MNTDKDLLETPYQKAVSGLNADKRRKFLKGAVGVAPVIMVANSRPALGGICSPSGFMSVSPSGIARHEQYDCYGLSPGAWGTPDASGNGSRADWNRLIWNSKKINPNPRAECESEATSSSHNKPNNTKVDGTKGCRIAIEADPSATLFSDIFNLSSYSESLHTALIHNDSVDEKLRRAAANAFLNAVAVDQNVLIMDDWKNKGLKPQDIINVYHGSGDIYSGMSMNDKTEFFRGLIHPDDVDIEIE